MNISKIQFAIKQIEENAACEISCDNYLHFAHIPGIKGAKKQAAALEAAKADAPACNCWKAKTIAALNASMMP